MAPDALAFPALAIMAALIVLPALVAMHRRRVTRQVSEVATALGEFAAAVRRGATPAVLDAALCVRAARLRLPELAPLWLVQNLPQPRPGLLADTAQRLALRLKRRVAFERKMLARTASGRRRGAVAASIPPLILLLMRAAGGEMPAGALALLLVVQTCGCWLLWRLARVEI